VLSCYWNRSKIGAYLDGALEDRRAHSIAAHLELCQACRGEADGLRRMRDALRRSLAVADPDWTGFWPGVVRGIEDARRAPAPAVTRRAWHPRLAWGGALAAALLVSVTFWQMSQAPGPATRGGGVFVHAATTDDPRARVMVYSTPEQDVAVVWLVGLDRD
jgi:anti-sigma factor RsiW